MPELSLAPASVRSFDALSIPGNPCLFLSLPNELIVEILKYLPVLNILQIESTCKTLLRLCRSRVLWLDHLFRTDIEHTPNIPPTISLSSLSTIELRKRIAFAHKSHKTWSTPGLSHDFYVGSICVPQTLEDVNNFVKPRMLPGRTEVFVVSEGQLSLWPIESGECIWRVESFSPASCCLGFDFDLLFDGTMLIVATLEVNRLDFTHDLSNTDHLRIFSFDLTTHESELLFQCDVSNVYEASMSLEGDYIIMPVQRDGVLGTNMLVVNWKESRHQYFSFIDEKGEPLRSAATILAKDHLITFAHLEQTSFSAIKVPLAAFEDSMSYDMEQIALWDPIRFCPQKSKDRGVTILPLPIPDEVHCPSFRLGSTTFTPAWVPDMPTEILMVFMDEAVGGPVHLISYHLRLSNSESSHPLRLMNWNDRPSLRIPWNYNSLSNAGHMFELTRNLWCFSLITSSDSSDQSSMTRFPLDAHEDEFLNPELTQPMNELELRPEILPEFNEREILRASVERWSGSIIVLSHEKLYVIFPCPSPDDFPINESVNEEEFR